MIGFRFLAICFKTKQSPRCPLFVAEQICLFETCIFVRLLRNAKRKFLFVNVTATKIPFTTVMHNRTMYHIQMTANIFSFITFNGNRHNASLISVVPDGPILENRHFARFGNTTELYLCQSAAWPKTRALTAFAYFIQKSGMTMSNTIILKTC